MRKYLVQRVMFALFGVVGATVVAFIASHLAPGDPVALMLGDQNASPDLVARLRAQYGLDQPAPIQYLLFLANAARGDFGTSYAQIGRPVSQVIADGLPVSTQLGALSLLWAVAVAVPVGVVAAVNQNSWLDNGAMLVALAGVALPPFVLATFLMLGLSVRLGWLPVAGLESWPGWVLPAVAIGFGPCALLARIVRASMLDVLRQEYMTTARAKGLHEFVVLSRHGLKNALFPAFTVVGVLMGRLVTGAFLIETLFNLPGVGRITVNAVIQRDYPVVLAVTVLLGLTFAILSLLVDLLYGVLDPRVRVEA